MKKKFRKLLALLTMLALIFTYSFSAGIISVYAEDKQPEATPSEKAAVSEEEVTTADPAFESKEEKEAVKEENDAVKEETPISGNGTMYDPWVMGSLEFGQSITLKQFSTHPHTDYHSWRISEADSQYLSAEGSTFTYYNGTDEERTVIVTHTMYYPGIEGYEVFSIKLMPQYFNVEYYVKDADASAFALHSTEEVVKNGSAAAPSDLPETKEKGGKTYTLRSWYADENCSDEAVMTGITENKKFYAVYEASGESQDPGSTDGDSDNSSNASTGGDSDNDSAVDTGDSMNPGVALAIMTLSAIALLGLLLWRRRKV
ncbi:MAG: LPXTG cell wall anchor domain-containing protein [Bacillota bacterium]